MLKTPALPAISGLFVLAIVFAENASRNQTVLRVENNVRHVDIAQLRHPTFQPFF
jgi:hypothetical protein